VRLGPHPAHRRAGLCCGTTLRLSGPAHRRAVIGMDPHKRSATIEVMDNDEVVLGGGLYGTDLPECPAMRRREMIAVAAAGTCATDCPTGTTRSCWPSAASPSITMGPAVHA
jgi:hypothetical protein